MVAVCAHSYNNNNNVHGAGVTVLSIAANGANNLLLAQRAVLIVASKVAKRREQFRHLKLLY
jgi:hypothetical protein